MLANAGQIVPFGDRSAAQLAKHSIDLQLQPANFINRDLSLIEFQRRVLEEAQDQTQPLLERLKFISILASNLDEFFMIRVSGLKERLGQETGASPDGLSTQALLSNIRIRVGEIVDAQMRCLRNEIMPELTLEGIAVAPYRSLSAEDRTQLDEHFRTSIYPLMTPQAVDPTHPFPYISGGSINLGLMVKPNLHGRVARAFENVGTEFFVRVKIPPFVPRLIPVGSRADTFVLIEDLTIANIRRLVPDATPESCHIFRITRDADLDLREAETEDLLETMEQNLNLRRFGDVVRIEVSHGMPAEMTENLTRSLNIGPADVYSIEGPLNVSDLSAICDVDRPDLKDPPLNVVVPPIFANGESTFELIKRQDILLHHPFNPYSIVTDFIRSAAEDPDVLAIKMCLYRIGSDSPIAPLLIEASERGKQVTVLIEIKARFDEENNIEWAKKLERAGVHVVYGLLGLKTHSKATLIIRREGDKLLRYVHLATGNYNPATSAFYTDLGLLTVDDDIGADTTELFNFLTVYSQNEQFKRLIVAPIYLRERMIELIERETVHARNGRPSGITAKMNRIADPEIVRALYRASQAGVKIDLIVRGICTLRPGVSGLSENIRVRCIVGRLLEHSRVYCFENGGKFEVLTGSADWMPRNLDRRVEVLVPVNDPALSKYLRDEFLRSYLTDNVKARELRQDGRYERAVRKDGDEEHNSQASFQGHSNIVRFEAAN